MGIVEKNVAGTISEIQYSPIGKVAVMNGRTQLTAYVPLPGGEILSPGPDTFWHTDWLGSVRLASSASQRTITFDRAFAPFGEMYNTVTGGTANPNFTGDTQDTVSGEYDTPFRQLHPNQGRWISPDPAGLAAVNPINPQTWNRYAYVGNNPLSGTDPLGLATCTGSNGVPVTCPDPENSVDVTATDPGGGSAAPWGTSIWGGGGSMTDLPPNMVYRPGGQGGGGAKQNTPATTNCATPGSNGCFGPPAPKNDCDKINQIASRVVAGADALVNTAVGGIKVLGGLIGAVSAPATGPAAPGVEAASDYDIWNGFWQGVNGVENGIYAATGDPKAQKNAKAATTVGTVTGLTVYGATGNVDFAAKAGSFENFSSPVDAIMILVDTAGELFNAGPCNLTPAPSAPAGN